MKFHSTYKYSIIIKQYEIKQINFLNSIEDSKLELFTITTLFRIYQLINITFISVTIRISYQFINNLIFGNYFQIMRNIQHRNRKYQQAYQDSLKSLLKYQTTIYKEHYDSNKKAKHKFALANQNNTYLQQLIRNANTQKQTRSEKISQLVSVKQEYLKVSQKTNSENQQLRQQILKKTKIIQELLKQQYSQKICIQQDKQFIQDQKNLIMKQCQSIQKDINISKDQKQKLKYTLQQKIKSIETQRQRQKNNILQQIKTIKQLLSNGQIQISKLQNTIQLNQQQIQQRINHRLNVYTTFDQLRVQITRQSTIKRRSKKDFYTVDLILFVNEIKIYSFNFSIFQYFIQYNHIQIGIKIIGSYRTFNHQYSINMMTITLVNLEKLPNDYYYCFLCLIEDTLCYVFLNHINIKKLKISLDASCLNISLFKFYFSFSFLDSNTFLLSLKF